MSSSLLLFFVFNIFASLTRVSYSLALNKYLSLVIWSALHNFKVTGTNEPNVIKTVNNSKTFG